MDTPLKIKLQEVGLTEKEAEIYLIVLEYGKVSASDLSRLTGINRTTVYSSIQNLTNMGCVVEEFASSKRYFLPGSPETLSKVYSEELNNLNRKKKTVETLIKEAKKLQNKGIYSPPKIRFIQEEQVENFLYEQTPVWIESIMQTDATWWGFQDHIFVELFGSWIDWFWQQTPRGLQLKLLSNQSKIEEEMKQKKLSRREIKFWQGDDFTATVWVVGEYIVTLSLQEHPHHIVQTHDPVLSKNLRNIFKNLWVD